MLKVENLTVTYGAAVALDAVNIAIESGEMVALIGANGAGKSTLVNTISGILRPAVGSVTVDGVFAQVPEGRRLFSALTVEDNLRLGAYRRRSRHPDPVYEVIPELSRIRHRIAGTLSGGEQQMVALGRALMSQPDVLAVDELSLGLAPLIVRRLLKYLRTLNATTGLTVLLIEQNASLALELCSRGYVLDSGRIAGAGTAAQLLEGEVVSQAYFGASGGETR